MKIFLIVFLSFFIQACATNDDWDSGASRQGAYQEQQAEEQVDSTNMQDRTATENSMEQSQPF